MAFKETALGAGERAQQLGALAALPGDRVSGLHGYTYTYPHANTHPQFKIINKELKCLNQFPR